MVYPIHSSSSRACMQPAMPDMPAMPGVPAGGEFVEGWLVAQLLGEGAYGEVRLLVHARSGACVALKVTRGEGEVGGAEREAALHRALRHPHVLRCLGARAQPPAHYTFLEYAAGGDLFDRIEPDVGMSERAARRYFTQLLAALRYLHERGVAHRDLKPENMLLDAKDDLKLSDFGLATLFRHGSRERLLSRVCGTLPYAAPEVLSAARAPYRAPPADLWAAGVVLAAMLSGELPWERALPSDARFAAWERACEREPPASLPPETGPWRKIRGGARALLRRALRPAPERRATLPQLQQHRWLAPDEPDGARMCRSQPPPTAAAPLPLPPTAAAAAGDLSAADMDALISHSQPSRAADLVLAGAASQDATQTDAWARLGARLTRVRVAGARLAALDRAAHALLAAGLCARIDRGTLVVECGGEEVRMRAWAVPEPRAAAAGADTTLLEFRRARGCGLRFQRLFREARRALRPLAPPTAPPTEPMDEA